MVRPRYIDRKNPSTHPLLQGSKRVDLVSAAGAAGSLASAIKTISDLAGKKQDPELAKAVGHLVAALADQQAKQAEQLSENLELKQQVRDLEDRRALRERVAAMELRQLVLWESDVPYCPNCA